MCSFLFTVINNERLVLLQLFIISFLKFVKDVTLFPKQTNKVCVYFSTKLQWKQKKFQVLNCLTRRIASSSYFLKFQNQANLCRRVYKYSAWNAICLKIRMLSGCFSLDKDTISSKQLFHIIFIIINANNSEKMADKWKWILTNKNPLGA